MRLIIKVLLQSVLLIVVQGLYADPASISQTKTRLNALDTKISTLQQTLNHAHNKNALLNKELAETEKKIGVSVHQLRITHQDIASTQQKIAKLHEEIDALNAQLKNQQTHLAKHLRVRYTMGEYQPLKWLLNQDDPYSSSRLLTLYQYIVKSRQESIRQIQVTKNDISLNQDKLKHEMHEQEQLEQQLSKNQHKLEQNKRYSMAILQALNEDISSKQHQLDEYKKNKVNLSNLLQTLAQQSLQQPQTPKVFMRNKHLRPVSTTHDIQNLNHGVVFFADEGAPVTAVSPGKVVFSDWLKGYGLLLIIDHGRGLMTLYAHNQSLFKQKGNAVAQGEQIATVGHSGGLKKNGLYFEIRERGKAIPPLKWLS